MNMPSIGFYLKIFVLLMVLSLSAKDAQSQQKHEMVRMAKIVVKESQLPRYQEFLKEEIETSLRLEPGVLTLYAMSEKERPNYITILEIYADKDAYNAHIKTSHFLKYKNGTGDMISSLELIDANPLLPNLKLRTTR